MQSRDTGRTDDLARAVGPLGTDDDQLHGICVLGQVVESAPLARHRLHVKVGIAAPPDGHSAVQLGLRHWTTGGNRRQHPKRHTAQLSLVDPMLQRGAAVGHSSTSTSTHPDVAWPRMTATGQCADEATAAAVEPTRP